MNPIAFHLFGQPIYWYGILISIGVFLGILLAMRNSKVLVWIRIPYRFCFAGHSSCHNWCQVILCNI